LALRLLSGDLVGLDDFTIFVLNNDLKGRLAIELQRSTR
jgi:hypothetical protein